MEAWTPYKGRYYLIPISIAFPLLACLVGTRGWWRIGLSVAVAALGLASMFTLTLNSAILKQITWRDALAPNRKIPIWPDEFQYQIVRRNVSEDASVGLTGGLNFRDYPFFGDRFTHFVTLAVPDDPALLPSTDLARYTRDFENSDYLLLSPQDPAAIETTVPQGFKLMGSDGINSIWVKEGLRPVDECDLDRWPFRDFFRSPVGSAVCPQFPITTPPIMTEMGTLYVPGDRFLPIIGSGEEGALMFDLWARQPTRLRISIRVDPQGYTRSQMLQLQLSAPQSASNTYTQPFSGRTVVNYAVPLHEGTNTVQLSLANSALQVQILNVQLAGP